MKFDNKLQSQFLELLIKFDLFLLEANNASNSGARYINKNTKIKNTKKIYISLTPAELIKSFKQFVRILQFLKKQKNFSMTVNFKNEYFFDFFQVLLSKEKNKSNIFVEKFVTFKTKKKKTFYVSFNQKHTINFYKKFFQHFNFLIVEFTSFLQKNDAGIYKVFADFNAFKKCVFFFLLIKKIYLN